LWHGARAAANRRARRRVRGVDARRDAEQFRRKPGAEKVALTPRTWSRSISAQKVRADFSASRVSHLLTVGNTRVSRLRRAHLAPAGVFASMFSIRVSNAWGSMPSRR